MGKRRRRARQPAMWVASADLPRGGGHPFYERLNRVLDEAGFDAFVESQCATFYSDGVGRPSLAPGRYFRMLLLGYFEGLDSERAIAWRVADSLSLRQFLDIALHEAAPDHSTVSRTRRRIDLETHQAVFTWVLQRLADAGLVRGKTVGIDGTTLKANAALRSIVRRNTGEGYETFLRGLAEASGISTPTRAELARFDRKRPKPGSNDDWTHPHDPDAKITRMKDGPRLAHKAEHAVDLETGVVVGVTVQNADAGDTKTMVETLITAAEQVEPVLPAGAGLTEVVGDKGYHSNETLVALAELGIRSYVSEPDRGRRRWRGKPAARAAVCANVLKRLLVHVCGANLGLLMRELTGVGTPRGLQGRAVALVDALIRALSRRWRLVAPSGPARPFDPRVSSWIASATQRHQLIPLTLQSGRSATAC